MPHRVRSLLALLQSLSVRTHTREYSCQVYCNHRNCTACGAFTGSTSRKLQATDLLGLEEQLRKHSSQTQSSSRRFLFHGHHRHHRHVTKKPTKKPTTKKPTHTPTSPTQSPTYSLSHHQKQTCTTGLGHGATAAAAKMWAEDRTRLKALAGDLVRQLAPLPRLLLCRARLLTRTLPRVLLSAPLRAVYAPGASAMSVVQCHSTPPSSRGVWLWGAC